jgi:hypothetical protein
MLIDAKAAFDARFQIPACMKPKRKTTQTFEYTLYGVDLVCELDYEDATGDGWHEPRYAADAVLCEAACNGVNIVELLSDGQRNEIELAFLSQEPEGDY